MELLWVIFAVGAYLAANEPEAPVICGVDRSIQHQLSGKEDNCLPLYVIEGEGIKL